MQAFHSNYNLSFTCWLNIDSSDASCRNFKHFMSTEISNVDIRLESDQDHPSSIRAYLDSLNIDSWPHIQTYRRVMITYNKTSSLIFLQDNLKNILVQTRSY